MGTDQGELGGGGARRADGLSLGWGLMFRDCE